MFDREKYFDAVRARPFAGTLTQQQVDGQEAILAAWEHVAEGKDLRWLAYMLATAFHETAATMWPIAEYGKGEGHDYGVPDPETGKTYYGRGLVQLTWKQNYQKAGDELGCDLVNVPELALTEHRDTEPSFIAARIMFAGMSQGWFTGMKLDDYFNATRNDPVNARQIINGNDKDTLVAGYHDEFLYALQGAQTAPAPEPEPAPPAGEPVVEITIKVPPGVVVEVRRV